MTDYFYGATEDEAIANGNVQAAAYLVEFEGQNCDDWDDVGCAGWDGESRRCDCGNRRVYWVTEQEASGKWVAYGEAW